MVADSTARHLASNFDRGRARCWLSSDALENSWKLGGIPCSCSLSVRILSVVLRTVISRGRDEYGAVEKTLKCIFTICTLLVFLVVVALSWTIYNGVKRFRYGGSVVPAMPSASGIRVFIHDETQGGCSTRVKVFSMDWYASCTSARSRTPMPRCQAAQYVPGGF